MKQYPAYKDSGIEWLGEIPEGWDYQPLKYITSFVNGAAFKPVDWKDEGIPIIRIENLNGGDDFNYFDGSMPQKYQVEKGDLLFGWSGNRGTSFGPFLWLREGLHYLNQHIFKLTNYKCDKMWLFWTLKAVTYYVEKQAHGIIGMVHITKGDLGVIKIPLIPLEEQHAIADFLDRQTGRIDELIEKKERQIELLKEKRAALISHAVTKGLDPDVPMKDSGIEWLGEIPAHWHILRSKSIFREVNERSITGEETLLTVSHITGVTRRSEKNVTMFMAESLEGYKKCDAGDLVINTMWAWMGAMGIAPERGIVSPSYNVYRFHSRGDEPRFYDYLFRTGQFVAEVICHSKGVWSSRLRLYPEYFFEIRIPHPSQKEQLEIVDFIQKETGSYDTLQRKINKSIEKLREYRTALISAAVTGKIDVREEVLS